MKIKIEEKYHNFKIKNVEEVVDFFQSIFQKEDKVDQDKEHFFVLHLDGRNKIKFCELVSLGTLNSAPVSPREVFTRAVRERTASIIVCHNHPTNEVEPSNSDLEINKRLKRAGKILDIPLLDSIIIANDGSDYWNVR